MGKAGGKLCYGYVYDSTWKLEDEIGVGQKPRFSHIDGGTSSFISYVDLKPRYQGLIHGHMKILKKKAWKDLSSTGDFISMFTLYLPEI